MAGIVGAFLTGLYTFRMLFVVFGGEQSAYVQEHPPHRRRSAGRLVDGGRRSRVLTVLAAFGGWIQFADVWTPITNWLDPVAEPLVEATSGQEAIASDLRRRPRPAPVSASRGGSTRRTGRRRRRPWAVLEHKFYFDELYDGLFYWPAVALSRVLDWTVEGPIVTARSSASPA